MASSAITDPSRLDAVRRSGLLDSEPEDLFDELTRAARRLLKAPHAFLTAVDDERSFWKSRPGILDDICQNSVDESFCQYVIDSRDELAIGDATAVPLTQNNPSIESMGVRAWVGVPVRLDDQVIGTFCVVDTEVRDWSEDHLEVLRHLASVASTEIARRTETRQLTVEQELSTARTGELEELLDIVRSSFHPPSPPSIPGVDVAVWHQAAHGGDLLLGDFYDAFPVNRTDWVVVVGDVCGHGAQAARLTAMIRYTLRAAVMHHDDLGGAVAELDRAVRLDPLDHSRFATLCVFRFTPAGHGFAVDYVRAGHLFPIHISECGEVALLETPLGGPPVGIQAALDVPWVAESVDLDPGDALVVYTDGVTECADADRKMLGEDGLVGLLSGLPRTAGVADAIGAIRSAVTDRSPSTADDTMVLAFGPSSAP